MVLLFKPLPVKDHYVVYCDKFSQGRVIRTAKLLGKGPWQREHGEREDGCGLGASHVLSPDGPRIRGQLFVVWHTARSPEVSGVCTGRGPSSGA